MDVNFLQSEKDHLPIYSIESGSFTCFKARQSQKAAYPMTVTESGTVTFSKYLFA